jgi:predicted component of type VI protein secretion system
VAKKVRKAAKPAATAAAGIVDPMQLWGSLTQQFQQIAASAMKDAGKNTAIDMTKNMATGFAKEAVKATKQAASSAVKARTTARKTARK